MRAKLPPDIHKMLRRQKSLLLGGLYPLKKLAYTLFAQDASGRAAALLRELADPASRYVFVVAHRGGWGRDWENRAPENSLANIDKAVRQGFDVYETDLAQTKDGHIVVMHDLTVDRSTNGRGNVNDLTLADLRRLRLKYTNGRLSSETVPTFGEFLARAKGRILFKIDYRPPLGTFPDTVRLVEKHGMLEHVFFRFDWSEIDTEMLRRFVDEGMPYAPNLLMFRTRRPEEVQAALSQFDLNLIEIYFDDNELTEGRLEAVRVAQEAGLVLETHSWGKEQNWDALLEKGFRMFHTRSPEALLKYLKRRELHSLRD